MGAYRELRRLPRGVSIASEFDELVEAAVDFAAYISAQGGANVPRDEQTVRTARQVIDELNEYDEEIQKIIGVYAPHLGTDLIHETRTTKWRIVTKAVEVAVHPLNLISASGAPRSPVNNCGKRSGGDNTFMTVILYEHAVPRQNRQQRSGELLKPHQIKQSARMTKSVRAQIPRICFDLAQQGITPQRWKLNILARGATIIFGGKKFTYLINDGWPGFSLGEE